MPPVPFSRAGILVGTFWEKPTVNSFESGWEIYKPVIAAVNGYCLGYGLTLVTWCDFVIASEQAVFGYPEVTPRKAGPQPWSAGHRYGVADDIVLASQHVVSDTRSCSTSPSSSAS